MEHWAISNSMKFNKGKHWILYMRQNNAGHGYRLGGEWLESISVVRDLGVLVDSSLSMSQQWAAKRTKLILGCIKQHSQLVKSDYLVYLAVVQPCLEYYMHFWASQYKKDLNIFESFERRGQQSW